MKITMNRAKNKRVNIAKKMNASLNNLKRIAVKKGQQQLSQQSLFLKKKHQMSSQQQLILFHLLNNKNQHLHPKLQKIQSLRTMFIASLVKFPSASHTEFRKSQPTKFQFKLINLMLSLSLKPWQEWQKRFLSKMFHWVCNRRPAEVTLTVQFVIISCQKTRERLCRKRRRKRQNELTSSRRSTAKTSGSKLKGLGQ